MLSLGITWGFTAFIISRWNVWKMDSDGKLGMVIALIIIFIVVKSFTDPGE